MKQTYAHLGFALLFLAIALGGYVFWFTELTDLSTLVADLTAQVDAKNQSAVQTQAAADQLAKLSAAETAVHDYFVVPENIVPFLEGLQSTGAALGAKVNIVTVSSNDKPRPHLDLSLKISGPFDAVIRSEGAIENGPHDIVASALTLAATDPTASSTSWSANMTLQVGTASSSSSGTPPPVVPTGTTTPLATTTP